MPTAPINGIDIYYETHGSGPPLLFAHGQGGNHLSWWQQVPYFARSYTCITYDQRAFGQSADHDGRGRMSFGADVIGLLDHLGIEDVRIVAHSMGGRSAIAVALRTERCKALVLSGTTGGVSDDDIRRRQRDAADYRGDRGLGAFSVHPGFRQERPDLNFLLREISRLNPARPRDFLRAPNPTGTPPANRQTVQERLQAAGIPTMFIVGEHDQITPAATIEACHRLVQGSRYCVVPDSGHSTYFERAGYFNQAIMSFLCEVDGTSHSAAK
jgi:pimeloyl-ACP methyl ester carboxylesterase